MELGVVFPQSEIGNDPAAIRDFAQTAEGLGFTHLLIYDHVLGADRDRPGGFQGPYDKDTPFHEVFVTLGFLAACTTTIELATAVLILPQRQTALVAKQAAEVDLLSGGRMRLGVGVGWNAVEYVGLNQDFATRGRRQEEQVTLLRALWANDTIDFTGKWDRVEKAGINPRPSRQIPIWFGGGAPALVKRIAKYGDGWFPLMGPGDDAAATIAAIRAAMTAEGRDPATLGIQAQAQARGGSPERWRKNADQWRVLGATHLAIATMNAGLTSPADHIAAIRQYRESVS